MPKKELPKEVIAALKKFRDENGKQWKSKLLRMWDSGKDYDKSELRYARNILGPSGLLSLKLEENEKKVVSTKELIEKALNENRFESDSVEQFENMVKGCVTHSVSGQIVNSEKSQAVAIIHDSSGYNPEACIHISEQDWNAEESKQDALEQAYEAMEEMYRDKYADHIKEAEQDAIKQYIEDHAEDGKTDEELTQDAYDQGIPESWWKDVFDGMVFWIPGNEILRVLKADRFAGKSMDDVSIEEPEVEEPEEPEEEE